MKTVLLITGVFLISNIYAQQITHKADSLEYYGGLKPAIEEYENIIKENPENNQLLYRYTCLLALDHQIDSAFFYLKRYITTDTIGWSFLTMVEPDYYFLIEDKRWKEIENIVLQKKELRYNITYKDAELSKELWRMSIKKNAYSYHIKLIKRLTVDGSPLIPAFNYIKDKLYEENIKRLEEIINEKGWPKKSIVKETASNIAFLIIYNADYSFQKNYFQKIKDATDDGEADMQNLARLIDRIYLAEGKQQIYGTQFIENEDGAWELKNLFEPEYVNQRRQKAGLGKIDEELFMHGIFWDFKQKEK